MRKHRLSSVPRVPEPVKVKVWGPSLTHLTFSNVFHGPESPALPWRLLETELQTPAQMWYIQEIEYIAIKDEIDL